jgi:adenylyltransferase/sulfurtransferase
VYEGLIMSTTTMDDPRPLKNIDSAWELYPHEVHQLRQSGVPLLLLDVRDEVEWEIATIAGAYFLPLDTLVQRQRELESWRSQHVVIYCRSGIRSLRALEILRQAGFESVHSMAGGIEAWAELVDPSIRWW